MSYSKFLVRNIVVPAGGWDFGFVDTGGAKVATVPAGTYDDILHLAEELEDQLNIEVDPGLTFTISVSQVGIVSIALDDGWAVAWGTTDAGISELLGYDETETVDGNDVLTASDQHLYGWYPGCITHQQNTYRGAGRAGDSLWVPLDAAVRAWSGGREQRTVVLSEKLVRRTLRFDLIHRDEVQDVSRGVAALWHHHIHRQLAWYPDRSDGSPGSYGTQGDPDTHTDSTCDWWLVDLVEQPVATAEPMNPSQFIVELVLNGRGT